jgi:hypothetical protein
MRKNVFYSSWTIVFPFAAMHERRYARQFDDLLLVERRFQRNFSLLRSREQKRQGKKKIVIIVPI